MKSILRIAAVSLTLAALAAVSTPVFAHQDRVELRFGNGYDQQRAYVQPEVIYESPAPVYRYQNEDGWRQQQWRERAWREREQRRNYWQQRNEWRERQWQEQRGREHEGRDDPRDHDRRGDWR
ncbi:MAG: hypothetical protein JWQ01_3842 [Massilia sp.]|nr:hypothetical protein [Massilia sp.]